MIKPDPSIKDKILLNQLRDIILREDREALSEIETILNDPELLSSKVEPIIEERLDFFRKNFPKEYRKAVDRQIEARLDGFKDELIGHIYPEVGKMIRKYVTHQFQLLKEKIDSTVKSAFSFQTIRRKVKSVFWGVDEAELVLMSLDSIEIEEIYVIQRPSGLLLGKASRGKTLDQEVVAGMLTAIKSFVEDAFQREREDLEMIQYGSYKIFIQNFPTYYFAIAMQGSMSASESEQLSTTLLKFANKELKNIKDFDNETVLTISAKLHESFIQSR